MATVSYLNTNFVDIDPSFTRHPISGDVMITTRREAVKSSVKNIILTAMYERPFQPGLSTFLGSAMFTNWTIGSRLIAETQLKSVLEKYEPRINLLNLIVDDSEIDANELRVTIEFEIIALKEYITLNVVVERVR